MHLVGIYYEYITMQGPEDVIFLLVLLYVMTNTTAAWYCNSYFRTLI